MAKLGEFVVPELQILDVAALPYILPYHHPCREPVNPKFGDSGQVVRPEILAELKMEDFYTARIHTLPNFTMLTSKSGADMSKESIFSLVSVLGSSISLVGLVFAFITYSLFSDLRNLSGTALMNLLASLFMTQLLYVIGVGEVQDVELCIGLAFALQYMRLTVFCWMLVMTHHMYFTFRDNTNLLPLVDRSIKTSFWQFSIFGWCSPVILLLLSIFLQAKENGYLLNVTDLKATNCWFLSREAFLYGFALPVSILLLLIVGSLIRTSCVIRQTVSIQVDKKMRDKMRKKRKLQLFLFIKLTAVISSVFFLSVLYKLTKTETLWIIFNLMQGLQGIIIALCVTCNCQVLKIYTRSLRKRRKPCQYGGLNKELSKSTSLQMLTWEPTPDSV